MYMICVNVKQEGFNRSNPLILFFNDLRQIFWCKKKKRKKEMKFILVEISDGSLFLCT